MSLISVIEKLPSSQVILLNDENKIVVSKFLEDVLQFRNLHMYAKNKNITIQLEDAYTYICSIAAMDGFCKSMLLLASDTSIELVNQFCTTCKIDFQLTDDDVNEFLDSEADSTQFDSIQTEWLLATSGTTGVPKIIKHDFSTLTRSCSLKVRLDNQYVWGLLYDINKFAGLQVVLQAMLSGSRLVLSNLSPINRIDSFVSMGVNCLSATPSMWRNLLMRTSASDLNLEQITLGGEIADQNILNRLSSSYPKAKISHIYASTEAGVGFNVKDKTEGFPVEWLKKSIGGVCLKISTKGTLLVKPESLPSGQEISERLTDDGYIDTQDMVKVLGNRVLFLGRESGSINVGGNKVQPEEVESVIRTLEFVSEAFVFAKSSSMLGELVSAEVVLQNKDFDKKTAKKEIIDHCKLYLDLYKIPIILRFVESLNLNSSGKIVRNEK